MPVKEVVMKKKWNTGPKCKGKTNAGKPCQATASMNGYCPWHSPDVSPEQKSEWAARGGKVVHHKTLAKQMMQAKLTEDQLRKIIDIPDLSNVEKVKAFTDRLIGEVKAGILPSSLANAINSLLQTKLKIEELLLDRELADQLAEAEAKDRLRRRGPTIVEVKPESKPEAKAVLAVVEQR